MNFNDLNIDRDYVYGTFSYTAYQNTNEDDSSSSNNNILAKDTFEVMYYLRNCESQISGGTNPGSNGGSQGESQGDTNSGSQGGSEEGGGEDEPEPAVTAEGPDLV